MSTLNNLMPFIGIFSALWLIVALVAAIFPGNRKRRLKSAGVALVVFVVAVMSSGTVEERAQEQEFAEAGVSSAAELAELREQERQQELQDEIEDYEAQLDRELAGFADGISYSYTDDIDSIIIGLAMFDAWAQTIERGEDLALDEEQELKRQRLKHEVSQHQIRMFPTMRDAYGPMLRQRLWEFDGYARTYDTGFRRIEIVNPLFAANRNIADFHGEVREILLRLRFTRADYKWFRQANEYSYYTMTPPADSVVGYWRGLAFNELD